MVLSPNRRNKELGRGARPEAALFLSEDFYFTSRKYLFIVDSLENTSMQKKKLLVTPHFRDACCLHFGLCPSRLFSLCMTVVLVSAVILQSCSVISFCHSLTHQKRISCLQMWILGFIYLFFFNGSGVLQSLDGLDPRLLEI